ncbi:MAG: hypothetical protein K8S25_03295 [Alphaproteobacteria bacterium]|nr:hypothetical protein [Alphaproteobacteria bacterium]
MARPRPLHLRDSSVTIASTALGNGGLNLFCLDCHHHARWTPAALAAAEPPARKLWDFKRRRKCSRCGARGSTDRVYLTSFVVWTGAWDHRPPNPTPPQLWPT